MGLPIASLPGPWKGCMTTPTRQGAPVTLHNFSLVWLCSPSLAGRTTCSLHALCQLGIHLLTWRKWLLTHLKEVPLSFCKSCKISVRVGEVQVAPLQSGNRMTRTAMNMVIFFFCCVLFSASLWVCISHSLVIVITTSAYNVSVKGSCSGGVWNHDVNHCWKLSSKGIMN